MTDRLRRRRRRVQIVERIIEMMEFGGDCQSVICVRYDKYAQSSPILELQTSSSWQFLLNRVGHDFMIYLLKHTSIFLPFLGKKHQQVSGPRSTGEFSLSLGLEKKEKVLQLQRKSSNNRKRLSMCLSLLQTCSPCFFRLLEMQVEVMGAR